MKNNATKNCCDTRDNVRGLIQFYEYSLALIIEEISMYVVNEKLGNISIKAWLTFSNHNSDTPKHLHIFAPHYTGFSLIYHVLLTTETIQKTYELPENRVRYILYQNSTWKVDFNGLFVIY